MRYLLDTNTCIHAMRGKVPVVSQMTSKAPADIAISSVTCYELYTGAAKCANPVRERGKVDSFIAVLSHFVFDNAAASMAANFRAALEAQGQMIGPYDILIAGHASVLRLTLVTGNLHEFTRISGHNLEDWSK